MNEHDSERIAGVLAADGMEPTDDLDDADVVVLNTCCIRENADNKLYGHLGALKALKDRPARPPDRGRRLPGPEGPRAVVRERAGHVDVVFGTHNLAHAPALLARRAGRRAGRRDPRGARGVPVGAAGPARRRRTRRGSRSRSAATTRARSASCRRCAAARSAGAGRHRARGRGARRRRRASRSRCSARTSTPTAATSAPGSTARSSPTCCARSTRSTASSASGSRRRTRRTCAPRRSRRWPSARRVCEHLHLPLQSGSDRTLARMHRGYTAERYLERLAAARAAIADLAVTTDIIVGFPGETDADFERTLEVVDAAEYDAAYTFVFSPRPGTEAADDDRRLRRARGRAGAHAAPGRGGRAPRAGASTRRGSGAVEEVLVEGPSKKDADVWSGRTRQNKLVHFAPERRRRGPASSSTSRSRRAAPHWLRGELVGAGRRPRRAGACASRSRSRVTPPPRARRPDRVGQVGARARGGARARRRRDRVARLDAGVPGHGHRHRQADAPPSAPRSPHHLVDVADPPRSGRCARTQAAARAAIADIEARGRRALLVGGTGLYVRAVVDDLAYPGRRIWRVRAELDGRDRRRRGPAPARTAELAALDPVAAARIEPGNRRRIVRALEVIELTGRPFSSFGPGLDDYGPPAFAVAHGRRLAAAGACSAGASPRGSPRCATPAWSTRSRALAAAPAGLSRTAAQAIGYREVLAHLARRDRRRSTTRSTCAVRRTRQFAAPPAHVVPARPAHHAGRHEPRIRTTSRPSSGDSGGPSRARRGDRMTLHLAKLHATGNDFLVRLALDAGRPRSTPAAVAALCDRHRGIGADGLITIGPGTDGADCTMTLRNADGGDAEMSGNGIRCLAWVAARAGLGTSDALVVDTAAGRRAVALDARRRRRRRRAPTSTWARSPSIPPRSRRRAVARSTSRRRSTASTYRGRRGRHRQSAPRAASSTTPTPCPVTQHGPRLEHDARFPQRTNVEFVAVDRRRRDRACGCGSGASGETLSCGTGACAAAAVAHRRGLVGDARHGRRARRRRSPSTLGDDRPPRRSGRARVRRRRRPRRSSRSPLQ